MRGFRIERTQSAVKREDDNMNALVCDLGGTSCRLGLAYGGALINSTVKRLENNDFSDFTQLLGHYLHLVNGPQVKATVIAVAAPIDGECVAMTNRDWLIDKSEIAQLTGVAQVNFINDFEALGHSLSRIEELETSPILPGDAEPRGSVRLVLGSGTGFNSAANLGKSQVVFSESGHTTFPSETALDRDLRVCITEEFGRCSLDRVLSGAGLHLIYRVICARAGREANFSNTHEIVDGSFTYRDTCAIAACREFARLLGRTAGDLSLLFLPYGGVYLSGGLTRALAGVIEEQGGPFASCFLSKGRMSVAMRRFPVHLILDDNAALIGCLSWLKNFPANK